MSEKLKDSILNMRLKVSLILMVASLILILMFDVGAGPTTIVFMGSLFRLIPGLVGFVIFVPTIITYVYRKFNKNNK